MKSITIVFMSVLLWALHRIDAAIFPQTSCLNTWPLRWCIYHICHAFILEKKRGRKITRLLNSLCVCRGWNGIGLQRRQFCTSLFVLHLIAPQVMFSACLHHSQFDIFINKSAQSTACQTCSLGLSSAQVNTYLFLWAAMKSFDSWVECLSCFCLIMWIDSALLMHNVLHVFWLRTKMTIVVQNVLIISCNSFHVIQISCSDRENFAP